MAGYEIILYPSQAEEAFIAEVPELPGGADDGKTHQEALANPGVPGTQIHFAVLRLGRPPSVFLEFCRQAQKIFGLHLNQPHPKTQVLESKPGAPSRCT
jgi:hypothetical protein